MTSCRAIDLVKYEEARWKNYIESWLHIPGVGIIYRVGKNKLVREKEDTQCRLILMIIKIVSYIVLLPLTLVFWGLRSYWRHQLEETAASKALKKMSSLAPAQHA